jgi:hypothetical protein
MRPLERLFSHPACEIYHNEDLNVIQTVWNDVQVNSDEFRTILNAIIKALRQTSATIILADARRMSPIKIDDQEWILKDWYPRAVEQGFEYQGLILAPESFNEMAVKEISEQYENHVVTTHYFTTVNEALAWIKEIKMAG